MSRIIEIYKPTFELFHEKPVIVYQEPKGPVRVAVNMFQQYTDWLNAWLDPAREKHAPAPAFWETFGPSICRALRHFSCNALIFEWESDRKVAYRWITRTPESPTRVKTDYYSICSVTAEGNSNNGESRVTVTTPTDEDVTFYFHPHSMKDWLRKPVEEPKP